MSDLPTKGLREVLLLEKDIIQDEHAEPDASKYVKLRFTRKQYELFRDACDIFGQIADQDFCEFVHNKLGGNLKMRTIATQLVNPIVEAPTKIPISAKRTSGVPKITYFTSPIEPTDACRELHSRVAALVDGDTKYAFVESNTTCITDIRRMISKYIDANNLKHESGTVFDSFLQAIARCTFDDVKHLLMRVDGEYLISKGDRKVTTQIVNEVAFGK